MPDFNARNPGTNTSWYEYYCDNPDSDTDEAKNSFFLNNFLSEKQRSRVRSILGTLNPNEIGITTYRKITCRLLQLMPNLAYAVPGWNWPARTRPLLVAGRAKNDDGTIDGNTRLRLQHINGDFFLVACNNHIPNNINPVKNPLAGIHGVNDPGQSLGTIMLTANGNLSIAENQNVEMSLTEFANTIITGDDQTHADFINSRNPYPAIPKLCDEPTGHIDGGNGEDEDTSTTDLLDMNTILYGPPGTGKTYTLTDLALGIIGMDGAHDRSKSEIFSQKIREGRIEFTTFHQNYAYEDFIEGLRADYKKDDESEQGSVVYEVVPGILKRISYRALYAWLTGKISDFELRDTEEAVVLDYLHRGVIPDIDAEIASTPKYVLIIDEINRGNVARIFGELITLIEDSKRARRPDELAGGLQPLFATLPYTKEPFILPPNLYIIGTMNTADRSLIGLDAALRRRFVFEEMPPQPELLPDDVGGINLRNFLTQLNQRIQDQDTRDHCIGHAYFMGVTDLDQLAGVMRNKVIPQLQEYFHDRPQDLETLLSVGGGAFVDSRGQINAEKLKTPSLYNAF